MNDFFNRHKHHSASVEVSNCNLIELHHTISDLTPEELSEVVDTYFGDTLEITSTILKDDTSIKIIECVTSTLSVLLMPDEKWADTSPCGKFILEANLGRALNNLTLAAINEVNSELPGVKIYRKGENVYAGAYINVSGGATAQTLVNQIEYFLQTSQRLQLSLFDATNVNAN